MSQIGVLKSQSLFEYPEFLDRKFAALLREEIDSGRQYTTPLLDPEKRIERAEPVKGRPRSVFDFSSKAERILADKTTEIKKDIASFFGLELGEVKKPYSAIYRTDDYLGLHVDAIRDMEMKMGRATQIATVIFLNDQDEKLLPDTFAGGDLTLYGLIDSPALEKYGYPIKAVTGKLVAFRSTLLHEVTPITSGTRYILNSGYY